jgi:hypothetical protein
MIGGRPAGRLRPQPRLGNVVAAEVSTLGEPGFLEDVHGRRARLYPNDVVLGAYGNRYATDSTRVTCR